MSEMRFNISSATGSVSGASQVSILVLAAKSQENSNQGGQQGDRRRECCVCHAHLGFHNKHETCGNCYVLAKENATLMETCQDGSIQEHLLHLRNKWLPTSHDSPSDGTL